MGAEARTPLPQVTVGMDMDRIGLRTFPLGKTGKTDVEIDGFFRCLLLKGNCAMNGRAVDRTDTPSHSGRHTMKIPIMGDVEKKNKISQ